MQDERNQFGTAPPPPGFTPAQNYPGNYQNYGPIQQPPLNPGVAVTPKGGWYARNQRNKPQSNAVGAGGMIFISGGMNIAWSIAFRTIVVSQLHIRVCWFIGAIIGAFLSSFLANKIPKKHVMQFSAVLVMIGGIVMAATKYNAEAITASLYLDGIANGLVFAPFVALAGEVSVPYLRGMITSSLENLCFEVGIFIQIVYSMSWLNNSSSDFTGEQLNGVLRAIYGLLAFIFATFLTKESPVIMLANGEEQAALETLRLLQNPHVITTETYEQLNEHKRYLAQNKDLSNADSILQALPAFCRLCILRALSAMSISRFMAWATITTSLVTYRVESWPFIVFALCRFLGCICSAFTLDSLGRKKPLLLGLLGSGALAIGIGTQFGQNSAFIYAMEVAMILLFAYQVFAGIAFTATSAYLSECYPLGVKQHFISFTFIAQMLVFIIISACDFSTTGCAIYFYVLGSISLCTFLLGIWCLPETKLNTLRECQDKFRGLIARSS